MESLYYFHAGMINDYFDKPDIARKNYENLYKIAKPLLDGFIRPHFRNYL